MYICRYSTYSLTYSLAYSLAYSLTHSLTHIHTYIYTSLSIYPTPTVEEWAIVKNYDGYDSSITGITPGSVLCDINDTSYKFETFDTTTKALSDAFKAPEPMKLRFRRTPVCTLLMQ